MRQSEPIGTAELRRLAKILALTQSPHDGEVTAAARKAAQMLARHDVSYDELFESVAARGGNRALEQRIERLERDLQQERQKSGALAAALRQAKQEQAQADQGVPILRSLEQLRVYLMGHFVLKQHERALLEKIEDPRPKTKEAHIVLICAKRYGVAFG